MSTDTPPADLPASAAPGVAAGPCVLLVDDNEELRAVTAAMLSEAGISSVEAGGATEARDCFSERPFDAVVIDLVMPGAHGLDLLSDLRDADDETVPAVVLSGLPTGETRDGARAHVSGLPHAEFLDKPVTARRLLVALGRLLGIA